MTTGDPPPKPDALARRLDALPIRPPPSTGVTLDRYQILGTISHGRYSLLVRARDSVDGQLVALKFPLLLIGAERPVRDALLRDILVPTLVASPYIAPARLPSPERPSQLYGVAPFYDGEALETRLLRSPGISPPAGIRIAIALAKAVSALHRAGILHRDIKPENVILEPNGAVRLVDFGAAQIPGLEDFPRGSEPGTASFMAPELFTGRSTSVASDLYALGVTFYRMFTRSYPYGEIEPFTRPRFASFRGFGQARADMPSWLALLIEKLVSVDPAQRGEDAIELLFALEHGAAEREPPKPRSRPLYERNPLLVWKLIVGLLAVALVLALLRH